MKYCKSCGAELVDEAVVCPKCGVAQEAITAEPTKHNVIGIVSFVLAIVGILTSYINNQVISSLSGLCNLAAFILGIIGISQAKKRNEKKGFAVAGLVISLLGVIIVFILLLVGIIMAGALI